ncbi:MAG: replicative DNA helicase [Selenomonadaceae bacterium]|nr:replicative DNA helicase [Selenomonadaceae bacterium]
MGLDKVVADVEIEKSLLSALLLKDGVAISDVVEDLKADDFYRPEHKAIYTALLNLNGQGTKVNILVLEHELRITGELKKVTLKYLYSLLDREHTTGRVIEYAKIIKEKALLRRLTELGRELVNAASKDNVSIEELLGVAEKKILEVAGKTTQKGFEQLSNVLTESFNRINTILNNPGKMLGVPSDLLDLDHVLNGFQKTDLILLAARPSMGKTALALNIGVNAAKEGKIVAIFSLEMSKSQLGMRLLSSASRVNSHYLNTGNISNDDLNKVLQALNELSNLKIYIDDTAGMGLLEMRSKVRRIKHDYGLDMIIIDYLQLMQGGRAENRQQEISEISRGLKALARELDVPILALSQLSRSVELRAEKKPQLSDLRESGSLEQDADIVMFLYRDEYYNRDDTSNQNIAELIIAKNRNGPTTSIRLRFDKEIVRFDNLTTDRGN